MNIAAEIKKAGAPALLHILAEVQVACMEISEGSSDEFDSMLFAKARNQIRALRRELNYRIADRHPPQVTGGKFPIA